ncbi:MAG: 3-deoxy-manno-octulosonate cytidylyltransferase [Planctomycetota bacterium]
MEHTTVAVIPARFASTRLPGKPLLRDTGKFLIQHVVEQVQRASRIDAIVVATDDTRIADAVASFGGTAMMTATTHASGTDRVAEVIRARTDATLVVNVQGDEPDISPAALDALVERMERDHTVEMGTLATLLPASRRFDDPNAVKVVCDLAGRALYFSRAPIPHPRADGTAVGPLLHLGVYAWRRDALLRLASLPRTPLEQCESLEQLRALEHGMRIAVVQVAESGSGIDTPEDYARFVAQHGNPL